MLSKVTKKAYHSLKAIDQSGFEHDLKVLNFTASGSRTNKLDRQCVVDTDTTITPGDELTLIDNSILVVSYKQADIYKNKIIRYVLDCIEARYFVDIKRTKLIKSKQGGLADKDDFIIHTRIPAKIGVTDIVDSKVVDVSVPKYIMYIPIRYDVQVGDRITLSDNIFEEAKINSLVHITPGLLEIRFDKDPRWL